MALTAQPTGRSIKAATTSLMVYNALVAQICADNAIVSEGQYAKDCEVIVRPKGFLQSNGSTKFVGRTNKFLAGIKPAVVALKSSILGMSLEAARDAAYKVIDANNVVLPVWEDAKEVDAFLSGRPFTAQVRTRTYTSTRTGEIVTEHYFGDAFLQEVGQKGTTLNMDDFAIEDKGASEGAALEAAPATPEVINAAI